MRNVLAGAMVITMALCIYAAVIAFAAVTPDLAWPAYGLAVLLALLWAGKLFAARAVSWRFSPLHIPVAAFFLYALARYFFSRFEYEARLDLINIGFCALVYFTAAANFYRTRDREWFVWALLVLAVFESIYGIYQFATRSPTIFGFSRPETYQARGGGSFICPNHLAGFIEIVLGLLLGRLVLQRASSMSVQQLALRKIALGYGSIILVGGLISTLSRAGWVAAAVGLASLLFWGGWQLRTMWIRLLVVVVGLGLLIGLMFSIPKVRDRVHLTLSRETSDKKTVVEDASLGGRVQMWKASAEIIRDHPVFGIGGGSWEWVHLRYRHPLVQFRPEYAHNDILQFTAEYGLIGGLLLAGIFGCFFWQAAILNRDRSSSDNRSFAVGAALGTTAILVHSWFDFSLHMPANALLLATIFGFTAGEEDGRFKRVELGRLARYGLGVLIVAICAAAIWFVTPVCLSARYAALGDRQKAWVQWEDALRYYRKAVELNPKSWDPHGKIADVYRSMAEWRSKDRVEERKQLAQAAVTNYVRALSLNPLNSELMGQMGRAYEIMGDKEQAFKTYQRMLEVDPNWWFSYTSLARFYRANGEDAKAMEAFKRSAELLGNQEAWINFQDPAPRPQ